VNGQSHRQNPFKLQLLIAVLGCSLQVNATADNRAPVAGINITNVEGFLSFRYLYDEQEISNQGNVQQFDRRPTFQQEFTLASKGYIFHPNFLSLDLGASLLLDQSTYESDQGENSTDEELFSFDARFDFLKKKPFPFTIYYSRQNPSVSTGLAGRFVQENEKYGLDLAILSPLSPVQVTFKTFKDNSMGEGFEQIIDEQREQAELKLHYAYGSGDFLQATFQENEQISNSGSPHLDISETITSGSSSSIDTRNKFGQNNNIQLTTNLTNQTRDQFPVLNEVNFSPVLNWKHTETLHSYYQFSYADITEEDIETEQNIVLTGLSSRADGFNSSISMRAENTGTSKIDYDNASINFDVSKIYKFDDSELRLAYKTSLDVRDQQADDDRLNVLGEEHVLEGITPVELSRDFIFDDDKLRVFNESRTQEFQKGTDFNVIQIGIKTEIQRRVEGNILDGQRVLIDYEYQAGGSFEYDIVNHNVSVTWSVSHNTDFYTRYRQSDQDLNEGDLDGVLLNNVENLTYGFKTQRVLLNGMKVGGEIFHEDHDEDISPFVKDSLDYYFELPLSRQTNIRFSGRHVNKEIDFSDEDTDLDGYTLRINSRPALRVVSSLESSYERDKGGSLLREARIHRLLVKWRMRQLSFNASIRYADERQGTIVRDRWEAKVELRRDFF